MNRREYLKLLGIAGMSTLIPRTPAGNERIQQRIIPSTEEKLPIIGLGTWQTFDVGSSESELEPLREILKIMHEVGATVVDSSPMYGRSEEVIGNLTSEVPFGNSFFYATKVWISGRENGLRQMKSSFQKMNRSRMDLMQIHNLLDYKAHMPVLREWKASGKCRYIGITHYTESAHRELETVMRSEHVDFIQCNFSIDDRAAEDRLLPSATDNGVAVLINRPFGGGNLFQKTSRAAIPDWAKEWGIQSWAQFFLKYVVSHPSVTCALAGTSKPKHARDNFEAGFGVLPDSIGRKRMADFFESI